MRALLGDGDDTFVLQVRGLVFCTLIPATVTTTVALTRALFRAGDTINTEAGKDDLTLKRAAVFGSTNIDLGEDNDTKVIDSLFAGDALADGGLGDDMLTLLGMNLFSASHEARSFE